jgi:NAD(P)-dependent dehydrogenase (short-subunit alcohol dehydrogenase family)
VEDAEAFLRKEIRELDKEVAVLIGSRNSIGAAIIRRVGIGRAILLADDNERRLEASAVELAVEGFHVITQVTNVSDRDTVASLAKTASALGPVTRVIHTADLSPILTSREAILQGDLLGTTVILEEFGQIIGPGGTGVVVCSPGGRIGEGHPCDMQPLWSFTPTSAGAELPSVARSGGGLGLACKLYGQSRRVTSLRLQAAAVTWAECGATINLLSPGHLPAPPFAGAVTHFSQTRSGPGRVFYVLNGRVEGEGPQFRILREEVSNRIFQSSVRRDQSSIALNRVAAGF